ncbi:alpha-amylase [Dysgonomonas sp. 511]|uniref:alpha-amylase n=1 Tax=Dysgonomonas sp. 511 TaxID=2302930 RepID=UPI0013D3E3CF|nr:alpha-amylase [Dysgonomonas sp. 511]NDV77388.1 alpha-amylase [Dysgonomonas sp. 511]
MKNGVMMQYFEWNLPNDGNLWKQLKDDAKHLHEIGITAVWIPPAYKADEQQDEGYATYDLYDLGEFEQNNTVRTKYGTKQELKEMIEELHRYKISVYLDTVMNHKSEGDYTEKFMVKEVDPKDRTKELGDAFEIQGWTGYQFKGRSGKYSGFKWHWYHFSGVGFDDAKKRSGVFKIMGENKDWSSGVDDENGNYDFLLGNDIDLNHPEVIKELNSWGLWVSEELNLDGMRLDAIKHMKDQFVKQFVETIRAKRGKDFYAVGEYWSGDRKKLENYLEVVDNTVDLFDVPLHYNLWEASQKGKDYDMQTLFDNALFISHPEEAVTFVDNHDSQAGSSLESQIQDWFKPLAYGLILLMKDGYPCLFYGDYYKIKDKESPHRLIIDIILKARCQYAYGEQTNYFDHPCTVGFVRMGDKEHADSGLAFLISNDEDGDKKMNVGKDRKGETWIDITGSIEQTVVIDENGDGLFLVKGRNLSIWAKG